MVIDLADYVAIKDEVSDLLLGGLLPASAAAAAAFGNLTIAGLGSTKLRGYAGDALPNVHAVGVGRKIVAGRPTDDLAIRIYVQRKLPLGVLTSSEGLPTTIAGRPTDVIESVPARVLPPTEPVAMAAQQPCSVNRARFQNPIPAGVSVGHPSATGTLGFFVRSTDDALGAQVFAVSNNHVFADVNSATIGDPLLQPGPADAGAVPTDVFARLARFHPIALGAAATNRIDAAIGAITSARAVDGSICGIGAPHGTADGEEEQVVCKHGRTTGYTEGIVADASYDAIVSMRHDDPTIVARFVGQLRIQTLAPHAAFGLGGDSGAAVLTRDAPRRLVGLYFAGPPNGEYGVANPIAEVLRLLKVRL